MEHFGDFVDFQSSNWDLSFLVGLIVQNFVDLGNSFGVHQHFEMGKNFDSNFGFVD